MTAVLRALIAASTFLGNAIAAAAEDAWPVPVRRPSIVYYGDALNQTVERDSFLENQARQAAEKEAALAARKVAPSSFPGIRQSSDHPKARSAITRAPAQGYGAISTITGRPRTQAVRGHYRKNGTYVKPYYRSRRR